MLQNTPSSQIIVVASDLHFSGEIDINNLMYKNNYNGFKAYSNSKLANILFTYKLNEILEGSKSTINTIHPEVVKSKFGVENRNSNLTFPAGRISSEESVKALISLSISSEVKNVTGKYFNKMNIEQSSKMSYNKEVADKFIFGLSEL